MKKGLIFFTLSLVFSCSTTNEDGGNLMKLTSHRDEQLGFLMNSYKYDLLKGRGELADCSLINNKLIELLKSGSSNNRINQVIDSLSEVLDINLLDLKDNRSVEATLLQNEILIYDRLIRLSSHYMNDFGQLEAKAILVRDTDEFSEFQIFLMAKDSLFLPKVELFLKSDTFLLKVENEGYALLKMRKKDKNHRRTFNGDIIVNRADSTIRYPFAYE